jgi:hypothetical protein
MLEEKVRAILREELATFRGDKGGGVTLVVHVH